MYSTCRRLPGSLEGPGDALFGLLGYSSAESREWRKIYLGLITRVGKRIRPKEFRTASRPAIDVLNVDDSPSNSEWSDLAEESEFCRRQSANLKIQPILE